MNTYPPHKDDPTFKSYNKRKLQKIRKRRKVRNFKILTARLRSFARLASYVLIIWVFFKYINLPAWYLDENIFTVYPNKYLEIEGNMIISQNQVMKKLQEITLPKKPLYLINTTQIENKLKEMTPVKKVFIRRYLFPARLRVVIDERTPVFSIAPTQKSEVIAVFTRDSGVIQILEQEYLPLPETFSTYKIITYDDYKKWKPKQIPYIEQLALYLERATEDKLVYLDIRNPDDAYAQMENLKLRIGRLNGKDAFDRIQKVRSVIPEAMKIKDNINYIDLRWNNVSIKLKKSKS